MAIFYPAVIDRNPEAASTNEEEIGGVYGVTFPDIPGCYASGDTVSEALKNAREALALHLEMMMESGLEVPLPTDPDRVIPDPDLNQVAIALIEVDIGGKPVRVNISIDSGLLDRIDAVTSNRSAFLAEGARYLLAREFGSVRRRVFPRQSAESDEDDRRRA